MITITENKIITLDEYLESIFTPDTIEFLKMTKEINAPVMITGTECTGKTTLERVLRAHGYQNVIEENRIIKLRLSEYIPKNLRTPNAYRYIE